MSWMDNRSLFGRSERMEGCCYGLNGVPSRIPVLKPWPHSVPALEMGRKEVIKVK